VAAAVVEVVHEKHPDMDIKVANAQGLRECRKLMNMAKVGKYNGYLLEGMACPGGCIAGAGTILPINEATKGVEASMKLASKKNPLESQYADLAEKLD
jgi:iron only hydrogenase large subunit-like protein